MPPVVLTNKRNPTAPARTGVSTATSSTSMTKLAGHWQHTYDAGRPAHQSAGAKRHNKCSNAPSLETDYSYDTLATCCTSISGVVLLMITPEFCLRRTLPTGCVEQSGERFCRQPCAQTLCGTTTGTHWTTCYSYDNNSNLLSKIDNRGISINYSYDALNRIISKTYSDSTPPVTFAYDTSSDHKKQQRYRRTHPGNR